MALDPVHTDALLYFGNVRSAYRFLRDLDHDELSSFFDALRIDTDAMRKRGPALPREPIAKECRYLISEMACKSFAPSDEGDVDLLTVLAQGLREQKSASGSVLGDLLKESALPPEYRDRVGQFRFSASALLEEEVEDESGLMATYGVVRAEFDTARRSALKNTRLYLSMIDELDVYVATSMRDRADFHSMAEFCDDIFTTPKLGALHLRYFDPTLSAAEGRDEDKGLIECLMVKSAKVLVYSAGAKESWGKDAEAAMALSLGKPVIFYCDDDQRERFYRDVHPLSRLIDFSPAVPVGAIVTSRHDDVRELLARIFENRMEYVIDQSKAGHLRLRERLTQSVVRLQTSDELLRETFWNYYHRPSPTPEERFPGVGAPFTANPLSALASSIIRPHDVADYAATVTKMSQTPRGPQVSPLHRAASPHLASRRVPAITEGKHLLLEGPGVVRNAQGRGSVAFVNVTRRALIER